MKNAVQTKPATHDYKYLFTLIRNNLCYWNFYTDQIVCIKFPQKSMTRSKWVLWLSGPHQFWVFINFYFLNPNLHGLIAMWFCMGIAGDQLCLDWILFNSKLSLLYCHDSVMVPCCSFDPKVPGSNPGRILFPIFFKILNINDLKLHFKYENLLYINNLLSYEKIKAEKLS